MNSGVGISQNIGQQDRNTSLQMGTSALSGLGLTGKSLPSTQLNIHWQSVVACLSPIYKLSPDVHGHIVKASSSSRNKDKVPTKPGVGQDFFSRIQKAMK